MKCIHCKGRMKKGTAPLHVDRRGCHLTLDDVPAWVCEQCGEAYFEEKEVETVQQIVHSVEEKVHTLAATQ